MGVKMPQKQVQEQIPEEVQELKHKPKELTTEELLVHEFVKCAEEVLPVKDFIKQMEATKKKLSEVAKTIDPTGSLPVTIDGPDGMSVTFKAATDSRYIKDMNGLIGVLKSKIAYEDLMGMISISLSDLDKVLSPLEQEPFVGKQKTSRTLEGYKTGNE